MQLITGAAALALSIACIGLSSGPIRADEGCEANRKAQIYGCDRGLPPGEGAGPTKDSEPEPGRPKVPGTRSTEEPPPCSGSMLSVDTGDHLGSVWSKEGVEFDRCPTGRPAQREPRISTVELSRRASAQLPVPVPVVKTAPPRGKRMLVRMPAWFWLDESQWDARSARAEVGSVWAEATASAFELVIDPGDGSEPFTCDAPGVPYAEDVDEADACTHTFKRSGTYTVRVTANWGADWEGSDGNGGTLPTLGRSTSFPVRVVEARSELIANS